MFLLASKRARAAAALLAVAAYALPLALGVVSDLAHVAHHVAGELQEHRRMAEALGLVHLSESHLLPATSPTRDAGHAPFEHTHGGTTHSHDGATDALLSAAAQAEEHADESGAPSIELSSHLPGASSVVRLGSAPTMPPVAIASAAWSRPATPPQLPPPRA